MDDEFLALLDLFLSDESTIKMINFEIWKILEWIHSHLMIHLKNVEQYKMSTRIKKYLSKHPALKANDPCDTLLHIAARHGAVESAIRLLECGADVHAKNKKNLIPIFYAVQNSVEMFRAFLHHMKVNDWDLFRQTLLYGTEEMFRILLNKSLCEIRNDLAKDANEFDQVQDTELLVNIFLQHKLHLSNMESSYPLLIFFAAKIGRKDILSTILNDCRKNLKIIKRKNLATFRQKRDESRRLVQKYRPRVPRELITKGCDGETALHLAVGQQLVPAVRLLLEEGADPNCRDYKNCTPLYRASRLQHEEICRLLVNFKANVHPNLRYKSNPLNIVCDNSAANPKIVRLLLENGADPEGENKRGYPALFRACARGQLEVVKILVEFGVDVHELDKNGYSALHHAVFGHSTELIDFLLEEGLDINFQNECNENYSPLIGALRYSKKNDLKMIEKLVSRGADINAMTKDGETALYCAVIRGNATDVECLLRLGADWTKVNIDDETLFIVSMDLKMEKTQEVLLSFIALKENKIDCYIKFYIGYDVDECAKAAIYFIGAKFERIKMKTMTIGKDCKTSYLDFLTKDFYRCVQIAKDSDFKTFLKSGECKNSFPCCAVLLETRFKLIQELEKFVDNTFQFVLNYTKLPIEVVEIIMRKLRFIDFRIFGSVLSERF